MHQEAPSKSVFPCAIPHPKKFIGEKLRGQELNEFCSHRKIWTTAIQSDTEGDRMASKLEFSFGKQLKNSEYSGGCIVFTSSPFLVQMGNTLFSPPELIVTYQNEYSKSHHIERYS